MILTPTTIVLGAGASMPYGFPSGEQLRNSICGSIGLQTKLPLALEKRSQIHKEITVEFIKAFLHSNVASIDAFLTKNSHHERIGKLCIAEELCSREKPESVMRIGIDDHWYKLLWNELITDANKADDLLKNKIHIITFNYDRSLEYFIHESIKYTYPEEDDSTALAILEKLNILHVYGELGKFHYKSSPNTRIYGNEYIDKEQIEIAANGIKVIPDARNDVEESFKQAREWFDSSDTIGLLGFGFDPMNVNRLGIKDIMDKHLNASGNPKQKIIVSTYKKTEAEAIKITKAICPLPAHVDRHNEENSMTIRSSDLFDH